MIYFGEINFILARWSLSNNKKLSMLKKNNANYFCLRRIMLLPILIGSLCIVSIRLQASEKIINKLIRVNSDFFVLVNDTTKPANKGNVKAQASLSKPVYYLDGVKITEKQMYAIPPNDIASVDVWKGAEAIKKYPKECKNGVVYITSKKANKDTLQK
jgi:hypothetical protein